jgi:hypothetical protein
VAISLLEMLLFVYYISLTKSFMIKQKMDSERNGHARIEHFASNYYLKKEGNLT